MWMWDKITTSTERITTGCPYEFSSTSDVRRRMPADRSLGGGWGKAMRRSGTSDVLCYNMANAG